MEQSNKAGNVLKKTYGEIEKKGDRVFLSLCPRSPELYFTVLGAMKLGAIVGPLFEAFMEVAVRDRLEDSEAKVLVTTPELLSRVPLNDLPALKKTVFVIGDNIEEGGKIIAFNPLFEQAAKKSSTSHGSAVRMV
ncbi:hypothetical protein GCM10020331_031430 [Ectobacillus funiculus]